MRVANVDEKRLTSRDRGHKNGEWQCDLAMSRYGQPVEHDGLED
jgi:hypothetical protein